MLSIINRSAAVYHGVIPDDRWHDPYMPREELAGEIADGVRFWGYEKSDVLLGVMGLQDRGDVSLIRHAYVSPESQREGIGRMLLERVISLADRPALVGTWSAASWAIRFYEKNGFRLVSTEEKERLLRRYWNIPERQIETSVVLADERYRLSER